MTTLVTFGDSHSAGAELECKGHPGSPERAYPAKIAEHYGWKSINLSTCGGSNAWLWKTFEDCMPILMEKEEDLFVLCNFTEISRMYFWDNGSSPVDPYNFEPYRYARHVTTVALDPDLHKNPDKEHCVWPIGIIEQYRYWLKRNTDQQLAEKTLRIIKDIQSICKYHKIPFLFHTSLNWFEGDWKNIDKQTFYGHQEDEYTEKYLWRRAIDYSYWGVATNHKDWKQIQKKPRWSMHYPEEYHEFWAKTMIDFIEEQGILNSLDTPSWLSV